MRFDLIMVGDFRFPGGTSTAVAEEVRAQAAAGYRSGLVQLKGPVLKAPHPIHPAIRACIDDGLAELLDPDAPAEAALVVAHHPSLFAHPPRRALALDAGHRLLVVDHPPLDGYGEPAYALDRTAAHAEQMLGGPVLWAPVGPAVREQFAQIDDPVPLLDHDWHNVLDPEPWRIERAAVLEARPVIGRHSRPDPLKWPDDREATLRVYPDDPAFRVRILGAGPYLRELVGAYPRNWQVWAFNAIEPRQLLETIDFFVYYHHSRWVEAFGRTVLEAMASGAVCVLPPSFEALFGDGAVYARPEAVRGTVRRLHADRGAIRAQRAAGEAAARRRFGPATHVERVRALIGPPRAASVPVAPGPAPRRRRVLFVSSNGVGMGHLVRTLAIARRCPARIEPVFLTFSRAFKLVREQGYPVEHLPFHTVLGCDIAAWNAFLREELSEILAFYEPSVVLFDGNVPYQGLIEALAANPELWSAWCRRGMWQPGRGADIIGRERRFDVVVEPRDLAEGFDRGLTLQHRSRTRRVDPIRLLEEADLADPAEARRALGLDPGRPAVLLQLGAGNNYDYSALRRSAVEILRSKSTAQVVVAEGLVAEVPPDLPETVVRTDVFPLSRYLRAFDFALSAPGYNSFHELLLARVPAIFVPNEHPQQDDQLARARFAESRQLGICVRTTELYRLAGAIERLLVPGERSAIGRRCADLDHGFGAHDAARLVEEMAYSRKVDLP